MIIMPKIKRVLFITMAITAPAPAPGGGARLNKPAPARFPRHKFTSRGTPRLNLFLLSFYAASLRPVKLARAAPTLTSAPQLLLTGNVPLPLCVCVL